MTYGTWNEESKELSELLRLYQAYFFGRLPTTSTKAGDSAVDRSTIGLSTALTSLKGVSLRGLSQTHTTHSTLLHLSHTINHYAAIFTHSRTITKPHS
ncbi:hypothetical protein CY34DRAFT_814240, partial [Suillus luteus UH-Slu-Lm8-n1]